MIPLQIFIGYDYLTLSYDIRSRTSGRLLDACYLISCFYQCSQGLLRILV